MKQVWSPFAVVATATLALMLQLLADVQSPANADNPFGTPVPITTGPNPESVAAGDLNGDAIDDIVTSNRAEGSISIILSTGPRTFATERRISVGPGIVYSTIADLDNDGIMEILSSSWLSNHVYILKRSTDAEGITYLVWQSFATSQYPDRIAIADFDGNCKMDIAVGCYQDANAIGGVDLFTQNLDGSFTSHLRMIEAITPDGIATGDIDENGTPDLLVSHWSHNYISVWLNTRVNGNATFARHGVVYGGPQTFQPTIADLNGDCHLDFVAAGQTNSVVTVAYGDGTGGFPEVFHYYPPDHATGTAVADLNGDGRLDFVTSNPGGSINSGGTFSYFVNTGQPGVNRFHREADVFLGGNPLFVAVADLNGSNSKDLVICDMTNGRVFVVPNDGAPTDTTPPSYSPIAPPDTDWHASDISIAVTATDTGSGLANPADASFTLSTSVPAGTETADAATELRTVTDVAGNSVTIQFTGLKVDKNAPVITLSSPIAGVYLINQALTASYTATDGGSGVASVTGTAPNGGNADTSTVGVTSFSVTATDNVGNSTTSPAVSYTVTYGVDPLFDQTKAHKSGSVVPIKLQLIDANGTNMSSSSVAVHAVSIVQVTATAGGPVEEFYDVVDADFKYHGSVGSTGGYRYNLKTKDFPTGTYRLHFTATNDPVVHAVEFKVK